MPLLRQVSDLGVIFDDKLRLSSHINHIVCKAHRRANLILRCFVSKDAVSLVNAFKVYARPILEYCSVVWCPFLIKDITLIEKVQRRFTRRLIGMRELNYYQRLQQLGLESSELRRIRIDLLFAYITILFLHVDKSDFEFIQNTDRPTRGRQYKLRPETAKHTARYNYFTNRVVRIWNILPLDNVCFSSLARFKNSLTTDQFVKYCKISLA